MRIPERLGDDLLAQLHELDELTACLSGLRGLQARHDAFSVTARAAIVRRLHTLHDTMSNRLRSLLDQARE